MHEHLLRTGSDDHNSHVQVVPKKTTQLHKAFATFLPHQYLDLGLSSCNCTTLKATQQLTYSFLTFNGSCSHPFLVPQPAKTYDACRKQSGSPGCAFCSPFFQFVILCGWLVCFLSFSSVSGSVSFSFSFRRLPKSAHPLLPLLYYFQRGLKEAPLRRGFKILSESLQGGTLRSP